MRDNSFKEQRRAVREQRREMRKQFWKERNKTRKQGGGILAGLVLLSIGTVLLLKEFGFIFPAWLFTWPMIIIAFGLFVGAGNQFRDAGWVVLTGVGTVFLLDKIWPGIPIQHFIWPVIIIGIGLIVIISSRRRHYFTHHYDRDWTKYYDPENVIQPNQPSGEAENTASDNSQRKRDNYLDIVTVCGGIKKVVYSKDFRGGDVVAVLGGSEINLMQADFTGTITIEVVAIMGGTKLIVPPHWQICSELAVIFGGVEDKRKPQANYDTDKVVILHGTTLFGGIEINSY